MRLVIIRISFGKNRSFYLYKLIKKHGMFWESTYFKIVSGRGSYENKSHALHYWLNTERHRKGIMSPPFAASLRKDFWICLFSLKVNFSYENIISHVFQVWLTQWHTLELSHWCYTPKVYLGFRAWLVHLDQTSRSS